MKGFSEKKGFVRTFCALSVAALMACSSLVTVAAAIGGAASNDEIMPNSAQAAASADTPQMKTVVLDVNGNRRTVLFSGKTVDELLLFTHTEAGDDRIVVPSRSAKVTPYMVVTVRDAKTVQLTADGKTRAVRLTCGKLGDALRLAGIQVSDDDILSASRDASVATIDKLTIQRVTYRETTKVEPVPFKTVRQNTDQLALGETKVSVKGKNGEKTVTTSVKYIDGKASGETAVSEKVTRQPVNEVLLIGTKGAGSTGGAGAFTDSNGVTVAYKELLTGSGTAYTADAGACTATGVPAYRGGVAVNPELIPYGSKLYVVSTDGSVVYGYCTAVDTGGALMDGSAIVDCFYDTYDECIQFGRRDVNVYVIE